MKKIKKIMLPVVCAFFLFSSSAFGLSLDVEKFLLNTGIIGGAVTIFSGLIDKFNKDTKKTEVLGCKVPNAEAKLAIGTLLLSFCKTCKE